MNKFCGACEAPISEGTGSRRSFGVGTHQATSSASQQEVQSVAKSASVPTLVIAAVLAMLAFTTPALAAPAPGSAWIDNGATACEKYLTPDVVAATLRISASHPRRLDANSCNAGPIYITLKVADIDVFRLEVPRIAGAHPMSGVGDGAFWNQAGAFSAVKGHDRGCDISVIDPGALKIHDAALGQKLGEICNKLFAIP